jgi:predicted ATPase/DNA-binding CsgD family transcriptional regulator
MQNKVLALHSRKPTTPLYMFTCNVPAPLTSLIGREQEVAAVYDLLLRPEVRLVTLSGPGGVGKTHLSLQIANNLLNDFTDGICFIPLATISDPDLVVAAIAQELGVKEIGDHALLDLLKVYLEHKQLLLLLDNYEQVLVAAPRLSELLAACPQLKFLVTSRAVLHIHGEHEFPVPPLALPDLRHSSKSEDLAQYAAVALFLERAQAFKPDFQVNSTNVQAIAQICVHLDGLPLAIELAAARIKLLPPRTLLGRLEHRLSVLTIGAQDVPARQQTLRNTLEWSYNLLDAQEQRLFWRLSVFVGGCTLQAIEAICAALGKSDGAGQILDKVASLIDQSLLQQTGQEEDELRLGMLETIREYGLERLTVSGEAVATRQAHAMYYLALAEEAKVERSGPQQATWLERLEREHDNLRAVVHWSLEPAEDWAQRREVLLRLGVALVEFWHVHGYYSEGRNVLESALAGSEGVSAPLRVKALGAAAMLVNLQGDAERATILVEESLALSRVLGDTTGIAEALYLLGNAAWLQGDLARAGALLEESSELYKAMDDRDSVAFTLYNLADLARYQGELAKARVLLEESQALFRARANKRGMALALLMDVELCLLAHRDPSLIRPLLEESQALLEEIGDKDGLARHSYVTGQVAFSRGDTSTARSLLEESLVLYRDLGDRPRIGQVLVGLAKVETYQGDLATAHALYEESLSVAGVGCKLDVASGLEGLANVVAAQGEIAWAARLWGAAEALRDTMGAPLPPLERAEYEHATATARAVLGAEAFTAAWAEGRNTTPEQALAAWGPVIIPTTVPAGQPSTLKAVPSSPPPYPDGLTAREVEVLQHVSQGLTDAQVADKLVITRRTVNWYLTSIYSKIQVSSRSAATRYALEHHLV